MAAKSGLFPKAKTKKHSDSALKERPLRIPGQSLDEALNNFTGDKTLSLVLYPGLFWLIALVEWIGSRSGKLPSPQIYAVAAALFTVWSVWRFPKIKRDARSIRQGRDGERVVGQLLEGLRVTGARIFHDIPADGFNLDHVVLCERGFYLVETKTWTKPAPHMHISVRSGQVLRDGQRVDPNPIAQAIAAAAWLRQCLKESTGKSFFVRPVVVFPEWFVEPMDAATKAQAWVLSPKVLQAFVEQEAATIASSDVALAAFHLSRYVRAAEEGR